MAKRFTDTGIWQKAWYRKLPVEVKLFWQYLFTNCNHAGIFEVDLDLASFVIGKKITLEHISKYLGDRIAIIEDEKWYILGFIEFQYGELNNNSNVHKSVLKLLNKYEINNDNEFPTLGQGLVKPLSGIIDKDKSKDKYMNIDKTKYFMQLLPDKYKRNGFVGAWKDYIDNRKELKYKTTERSIKSNIKFLLTQPDPVACINQTIVKGWNGLFEVKNKGQVECGEADKINKALEIFLDDWQKYDLTLEFALGKYKSHKYLDRIKEILKTNFKLTSADFKKKYNECINTEFA